MVIAVELILELIRGLVNDGDELHATKCEAFGQIANSTRFREVLFGKPDRISEPVYSRFSSKFDQILQGNLFGLSREIPTERFCAHRAQRLHHGHRNFFFNVGLSRAL